jgi:hypothetical protein
VTVAAAILMLDLVFDLVLDGMYAMAHDDSPRRCPGARCSAPGGVRKWDKD